MNPLKYYIYFITTVSEKGGDHLKIGVTTDINERVKQIQTGCPLPIKTDCLILMNSKKHAFDLESQLHDRFQEYMTCGEWFVKGKVYGNKSIQEVIKNAKKANDVDFRKSRLVRSKDKQNEMSDKLKKANGKIVKNTEKNAKFKRDLYKIITGKDSTKSITPSHLINLLHERLNHTNQK